MINVRFFDKEQKEFDHEQEHGRESLQFFLNHGATGASGISQDDVHDAIEARCALRLLARSPCFCALQSEVVVSGCGWGSTRRAAVKVRLDWCFSLVDGDFAKVLSEEEEKEEGRRRRRRKGEFAGG